MLPRPLVQCPRPAGELSRPPLGQRGNYHAPFPASRGIITPPLLWLPVVREVFFFFFFFEVLFRALLNHAPPLFLSRPPLFLSRPPAFSIPFLGFFNFFGVSPGIPALVQTSLNSWGLPGIPRNSRISLGAKIPGIRGIPGIWNSDSGFPGILNSLNSKFLEFPNIS